MSKKIIGILALQGAFEEHVDAIKSIGHEAIEVRQASQLQEIDGLIIPGGESTAIANLAEKGNMLQPLRNWVKENKPVWGTCAGMIMLCDTIVNPKEGGQTVIGGLKGAVKRNFFGSQVRSFISEILGPPGFTYTPYQAIFIRAPALVDLDETQAIALAQVPRDHTDPLSEDVIVAARQNKILVTAFHPELTRDTRWHQYFIRDLCS